MFYDQENTAYNKAIVLEVNGERSHRRPISRSISSWEWRPKRKVETTKQGEAGLPEGCYERRPALGE